MQISSRAITPLGSTSTSDDVIAGVDLGGRRAFVTGGASGIGLETARVVPFAVLPGIPHAVAHSPEDPSRYFGAAPP
jgi:hypothetical protein